MADDTLTLWLAGDVMTGRGIDQVQLHPGDPTLYEPHVRDARDYVRLAEKASAQVPAPVTPDYIWGDALSEIDRRRPDLRLANLETAITRGGRPWPDKVVHYRMHPDNIGCLLAARLDCVALANNHVLDWGQAGLHETLQTLQQAGVRHAGAGADAQGAAAPAALLLDSGTRLLLFSWAGPDSGVPERWAATPTRPGVALLPQWDDAGARQVAAQVAQHRRPGDRVVVSLHWGSNWGMEVPRQHRAFARQLIDLGAADLVHGHSSHHPRPIEVYRGHLILYGCGDLINDYEGIAGQEAFDPTAVCLYFAQISRASGELQGLEIVPMRLRRLQLVHADAAARQALQSLWADAGKQSNTGVRAQADGGWRLQW
jgi:poly-gamma-glutamate synthesis protein (capsule biosynthesis protein)